MADEELNPYAPPALVAFPEDSGGDREDDGPNIYERERRAVALVIGLTIITLGIYPAIWMLQRRPFLDRLDTQWKLGGALPSVIVVTNVLSLLLAFGGQDTAAIRTLMSLVGGICALIAAFRILAMLRSDSSRTGRFLEFSTIATFFFGVYYLQYKINQMADTPARALRPRRTKRKKARVAPPADGGPEDAPVETEATEAANDAPAPHVERVG